MQRNGMLGDEPGGLVLDLRGLNAGMLGLAGGKAANLGELLAAGLPVPDGFCLTTNAYRQAVSGSGALLPDLARVYAALHAGAGAPTEMRDVGALAGTARAAILAAPFPAAVSEAAAQAYAALGSDVPVAVRSSATAEDLPFASFAGQQETYLNIVGVPALLDAVQKCWASLWTDRATAYRAGLGIDPAGVALAVVVQRMVDADTAGVLFTANPLTGSRRQTVIDASPGLGEAVVSGAVNPDHFVVDALTGKVLERKIGAKGREVRPLPGGGTEVRESPGASDAPCLADTQVAGLVRLGQQAEAHFGAPQDIEWAIDGAGTLWLTQSRPITTLYPVPQSNGSRGNGAAGSRPPGRYPVGGTRAYLCFSLAQGLTRPLTPMGLAAVRLIASSVAMAAGFQVPDPRRGPSPYAEAGQRIYIDFTTPLRSAVGRRIVPRVFDIMEARTAAVMRQLFEDPAFSVTTKTPFGLLHHVGPVAVRAKVPANLLRALARPEAALRRLDRFTRDFDASLALDDEAGPLARLDHAESLLGSRLFQIIPAILPLPAAGFAMLGVAGRLLGGQWDELQPVIRGLPNNVTTQMDLELWHLAEAIRDDVQSRTALMTGEPALLAEAFKAGQLPARLDAGLNRFLERYGHRAVAEIDVGQPRWSEEPAHILGILANYLRLDNPALAPDVQFSRAAEEAEAQVDRLVARAAARGRLRGMLVRGALRRARLFAGLRELPKYQLVGGLGEVRRQMLLVGRALADSGTLERPDDVFFLGFDEARQALAGSAGQSGKSGNTGPPVPDFRALVLARRGDFDRELGRRHIPRVLLSDGTEPEAVRTAVVNAAEGTLTGSPASAGTVTAVARVILDPVGARLEPGEILVAPSTDPGWTPLFLTAGGLVMEMGGPNSHGAVVAREYGIPAVVGVADATVAIATGQKITVDGGSGTVVPERSAALQD